MKSISIIKTEHRNLLAVLSVLSHLVREIEDKGKKVPFSVFHGIAYYLDNFLDRYHHPKENDYLFPAILKRNPESETVIRELGSQHGEGERQLNRLVKALSAYEFLGEEGFPEFRDAVNSYLDLERTHIELEENEILPLARECLEHSDWDRIDEAFTSNVDPLFGTERRREFGHLFNSICELVPAPYGLGPEISNRD